MEIEQQGGALQGEFRYGFSKNFSAGFSVRYLDSKIAAVGGIELPEQIAELTDVSIATAGLVAKWDTRDDTFYPTGGNSFDLSLTYSEESGGLNLDYTSLRLGYNQFRSLNDKTVIGARLAGCAIEEKAPFFDSCLLGGELRGFSLFENYGRSMLTAQAEYRRRLSDRFGVVAFAGAGDVQSNFSSLDSGMRYAGLRYRVSKEFGLDVALDATINDDSTSYIYF